MRQPGIEPGSRRWQRRIITIILLAPIKASLKIIYILFDYINSMTYYDKIAKGYDELYKEEQLKKVKLIIKHLNIKNEKVLDIGCGTAFYSNLFKNYTGIDNSKKMIKGKKECIYANAESLPFNDESFDAVICITSIHNFKDIKKALNEMKRVCKNKIAISVLKKAKKFEEIKKLIKDNFKVQEIEEEKDIIFISAR